MKNNKGFSLVELAIGLAVITILIMAVSISAGIRDNARIQSASSSIRTLRTAAENYLSKGNLNYAGMDIAALQTAGFLPPNFTPDNTNPWGGSFSITPNSSDNTHFDIALSGLSQAQADTLTNHFNNNATSTDYDASKATWTVTF